MLQADTLYERYIRDVSQYPRITPEREAELSRIVMRSRSAKAVQRATDELVQSNLLLVVHCAKEFMPYLESPGTRITAMDLIAEGNIGLCNAARNFDSGRTSDRCEAAPAIRFSTYACKSIKNAMRRALKLSRFIHIPEHHFGYWTRMRTMAEEHGGELSDRALAQDLGVGVNKLQMLRQSQESVTTLLDDLPDASGSGGWREWLEDAHAVSPRREAELHDLREYLQTEMANLPDRTQRMIGRMFLEDSGATFSDLAREHGISKERCRQLCRHGLDVLRGRLEMKMRPALGGDVAGSGADVPSRSSARPAAAYRLLCMPCPAVSFNSSAGDSVEAEINAA